MTANAQDKQRLGVMELLGIIGFSLLLCWFACNYFWFFAHAPEFVPLSERLTNQWLLIAGFALGHLCNRLVFARFLKKKAVNPLIVCYTVVAATYPMLKLIGLNGIELADWIVALLSLLVGFSSSHLLVGWMDFCGKARVRHYQLFFSLSFVGASVLFALCFLMPIELQPIYSIATVVLSSTLWLFSNARVDNTAQAVERKRTKVLSAPQELEALFVIFGVCFGAIFVLMFELGTDAVLWGILGIILGSVVIAAMAAARVEFSVVSLFRVGVVILTAVCLAFPFGDSRVQATCCSIAAALWVVFTVSNYANVTKQITERKLNVLYNVSTGLIPKICGFAAGWLLVTVIVASGPSSLHQVPLMLCLAFFLVLVTMVFYPSPSHHDYGKRDEVIADAQKDEENAGQPASTVSPVAADDQVLQKKCEAVARQFLLSPRESDVLNYLVRGRNADYIRNKLVLSPHTVKSHIASIYRKTSIHNQQKLMIFVEEFDSSKRKQ